MENSFGVSLKKEIRKDFEEIVKTLIEKEV